MPQRHTKNNGSSTYGVFSRAEREKCEFMSSLEMRAGVDSQLPFGWCSLSLQPALDPVVTPSGHVYSRECILEHMVTKSAELKRAREAWEAQEKGAVAEAAAGEQLREEAERAEFERANDPRINSGAASRKRKTREEAEAESKEALVAELMVPIATKDMVARNKASLAVTNYWLPQFTPHHTAQPLKEPERRPPSPVTGAPLRAKDLVPLKLEASMTTKVNGSGQDEIRYLCHVSKDEITTQPVILIRNTGCVCLEAVAKRLGVLDQRVCPITSRPFKSKDVVQLKSGTSAYAANGGEALMIKVYRAKGGGA